jgi:hypothetical protein
MGASTASYAFIRQGTWAKPASTGNNASDFTLVATNPASVAGSVLGSPSPLSAASPQQMNGTLQSTLAVPSAGTNGCPNRVVTSGPTTLVVSRTITNTTGANVTSLQARITSITEQGAPAGNHAWLRVISTTPSDTIACASGTYHTHGLQLVSISGATSGGLGSVLVDPAITLMSPLAPGQSVAVTFTFAVDQGGSYSFGYDVDATTG